MVGALSGALGAIVTTPADVIKTRIMTAPVGSKITASQILIDILKAEGLPALFKGEKCQIYLYISQQCAHRTCSGALFPEE